MPPKRRTTTSRKPSPARTPTPTPTPPPPVDYLIEVKVDKKGNFTYKSNGQDAQRLRPNLGDRISWSVKVNGKRKPFQIEFPGFSPFGFLTRVIRSGSKPTKWLTVELPKKYKGNLVMDYRVTVPNAWSDDPDIIPPSSDGFILTDGIVKNSILLVTDDSGDLSLDPTPASFPMGEVAWEWKGPAQDDFILTFDTPPSGWPKNPTPSVNGILVLPLMTASSNQGYKIDTVHSNLTTHGVLTVR